MKAIEPNMTELLIIKADLLFEIKKEIDNNKLIELNKKLDAINIQISRNI